MQHPHAQHLEPETTKCFPVLWLLGNQSKDPGPAASTSQEHCSLEASSVAHPTLALIKLWAWSIEKEFYPTFQVARQCGKYREPLLKMKNHLGRRCAAGTLHWQYHTEPGKSEASFWQLGLLQGHYCHLPFLQQIIKLATSLHKHTRKNIWFFPDSSPTQPNQ